MMSVGLFRRAMTWAIVKVLPVPVAPRRQTAGRPSRRPAARRAMAAGWSPGGLKGGTTSNPPERGIGNGRDLIGGRLWGRMGLPSRPDRVQGGFEAREKDCGVGDGRAEARAEFATERGQALRVAGEAGGGPAVLVARRRRKLAEPGMLEERGPDAAGV